MRGSTVGEQPGSRHAHHTRQNHQNDTDTIKQSHTPRPKRVRGISYTETMYPDVDTAKRAFEQERNQAIMNRAPTPFIQGEDDDEDVDGDEESTPIGRKASNRTLRSRVSFESSRSRRSVRTIQDPRTDAEMGDDNPIGPWEPGFGARNGIGPGGEAYEVIGLGRKSPRHRKLPAQMLKPAIKSTSRVASRSNLREDGPSHSNNHDHRRPSRSRRDKPLPSRPQSYINPVFGNIFQSTTNVSRSHPGPASPISPQFQSQFPNQSRSQSRTHRHNRSASTSNPSALPFRSLFSSLSIDPTPSSSRQALRPPHQSRSSNDQRRDLLEPAEDLYGYLLLATVPSWRNWPASGPQSRQSGFWNANRAKGFESMGWEWRRRQQLAEMNRMTRGLRVWDGADKYWDNKIIECEPTYYLISRLLINR